MAVFGGCLRTDIVQTSASFSNHHIYMVPVVLMCLTWVMTDDIMSVVFHTLIIACKFLDQLGLFMKLHK